MLDYNKNIVLLTKIFFVVMLLNYMVITVILKDHFLFKYLKDVIIMILLFFSFTYNKKLFLNANEIVISLFIVILLISALKTSNLTVSIYLIRKYMLPLFVFIISMNLSIYNKKNIEDIMKFLFYICVVLSIWGIFQAHILKDTFLLDLGYERKYEAIWRLKDSFYFGGFGIQRVVSTICNSNVFSLLWGMLIIFYFINSDISKKIKYFKQLLPIMIFAYILTFSRSNILAMVIVLIFHLSKYIRNKTLNILKISVVIILINIMLYYFSNVDIFKMVFKWVYDTVTLNESSAQGRTYFWQKAIEGIIQNPTGIGLGKVGTVSQIVGDKMTYVSESSYFAVALDNGIQGLIVYIVNIFILLNQISRKKHLNSQYMNSIKIIWIYFAIVVMFSNHIYDIEVTTLIYFLSGLALNKKFINTDQKNIGEENESNSFLSTPISSNT